MNNKIYLCVITQDEPAAIDLMTRDTWDHFDGLFIVDHSKGDETYDVVKDRIKGGEYLRRPFFNHTAHSMNDWLLNPKIEFGDWCWLNDTHEICVADFTKNIRYFVNELKLENINSVYSYEKLFLFNRQSNQLFQGPIHWGLQGARGNTLEMNSLPEFKDKPQKYRWNNRPNARPSNHIILHFYKYYATYADSNHLLMFCKEQEAFNRREALRLKFRRYLRFVLKIDYQPQSFVDYLQTNGINDDLKYFFNNEPLLMNVYRHYVLNEDAKVICDSMNIFQLE